MPIEIFLGAVDVHLNLLSQGGVAEMEKRNIAKAKILYDYLDESKLFHNPVRHCDRSLMNVTFVTGDADKLRQLIGVLLDNALRPSPKFRKTQAGKTLHRLTCALDDAVDEVCSKLQ